MPGQGDDYILYCHPSKQKTPRSDRLRAWYHDMLRKARDDGSVCHVSTLWDTFFEGGRDHRWAEAGQLLVRDCLQRLEQHMACSATSEIRWCYKFCTLNCNCCVVLSWQQLE